jgi:predicted small lipoprotein YifL
MRKHPQTFALLVALAALVGCGQKGPLYLPDAPKPQPAPAPATAPAPAPTPAAAG